MSDDIENIHQLLEYAVSIYQEGLECLDDGEFDQLDDVMFRRKRVLDKLQNLVGPHVSVDPETRECARRVMQLEEDFVVRVDQAVTQIRAELVRTKKNRHEAHAYERARP
jgi:hypothetical protein